jgi:hypothetical protein
MKLRPMKRLTVKTVKEPKIKLRPMKRLNESRPMKRLNELKVVKFKYIITGNRIEIVAN